MNRKRFKEVEKIAIPVLLEEVFTIIAKVILLVAVGKMVYVRIEITPVSFFLPYHSHLHVKFYDSIKLLY